MIYMGGADNLRVKNKWGTKKPAINRSSSITWVDGASANASHGQPTAMAHRAAIQADPSRQAAFLRTDVETSRRSIGTRLCPR